VKHPLIEQADPMMEQEPEPFTLPHLAWPEASSLRPRRQGAGSMRDALCVLMSRWEQALIAHPDTTDVYVPSEAYALDASLLAFIGDLATQVDDKQLFERAGALTLELTRRATDLEAHLQCQYERESREEATRRNIVRACYSAFFKRHIVTLDLSDFHQRIDAARDRLAGTDVLRLLDAYFDPVKKRSQVYLLVRDMLVADHRGKDLSGWVSDHEILTCVAVAMEDVRRRAELYLLKRLAEGGA